MADYYTQFSCLLPLGSAADVAPALALYGHFADELYARDEAVGFVAEAGQDDGAAASLWLHDDAGDGDPEHVVAFVLACAEALGLTGRWGFAWALTCSKPRLDGFGGGAQLLDLGVRRSVARTDCDHWLASGLADRAGAFTGVVRSAGDGGELAMGTTGPPADTREAAGDLPAPAVE